MSRLSSPSGEQKNVWLRRGALIGVLALLALVYLLTLQRDINGSGHEYMIDVGEIQVALNLWGTIHHTGYPLYTIIGASLVALFRLLGINPAMSASLVSTLFGLAAIGVVYALLLARTARPLLAAALSLALGLTQSYWIHSVVAEVYSLYVLFVALALWWVFRDERRWEMRDWLVAALILGLGVGHHRAVAFIVPGLAVWLLPRLWQDRRRMPLILALGTLVFLATFTLYLYLPLRDRAGARWVYGQPGTWEGFWHEFLGREAQREMDPPHSLADFGTHVGYIAGVLGEQVTWPGLAVGAGGVIALLVRPSSRRFGAALLVGMLAYLGFAFWLPEAVLAPAFLMPVPLLLALAVGEAVAQAPDPVRGLRIEWAMTLSGLALAAALFLLNRPFVRSLTSDPGGRRTIEHVATLPVDDFDREPILMLPWGGSYFAVSYGRYVTDELEGFTPVDHRADLRAIVARGEPLVTLPETFYVFPPGQWNGWPDPLHLTSVGPGFVQVGDAPLLSADRWPGGPLRDLGNGVALQGYELADLPGGGLHLILIWQALRTPGTDYSVFVHLARIETPAAPEDILAQADLSAPVYGWYPTGRWPAGEVVRDDVIITPPEGYGGPLWLRVGMYRQREDGSFENFEALTIRLR